MHCFKHGSVAAIGICKFCGKGVCSACVADTGHGLACRDSCEEDVDLQARILRNNAKVLRAANAQARSAGIFAFVLGLCFLGVAWWLYDKTPISMIIFFSAIGLLFTVFGLLRMVERYPNPDEQRNSLR